MSGSHHRRPTRGRDGLDRPSRLRHSARVTERKRDWDRLKYAVIQARVAAGYETRKQFADAITEKYGYIATRTLGQLERGQAVAARTLTVVELILGWPAGTCETVLNGGDPPELAPAQTATPPADDPDEEFRRSLRVMRRAMGREAFLRWVDENSLPTTGTEGDQAG